MKKCSTRIFDPKYQAKMDIAKKKKEDKAKKLYNKLDKQ